MSPWKQSNLTGDRSDRVQVTAVDPFTVFQHLAAHRLVLDLVQDCLHVTHVVRERLRKLIHYIGTHRRQSLCPLGLLGQTQGLLDAFLRQLRDLGDDLLWQFLFGPLHLGNTMLPYHFLLDLDQLENCLLRNLQSLGNLLL